MASQSECKCQQEDTEYQRIRTDPQDNRERTSMNAHQPLDALAVHLQLDRHFAASEKRTLQVQLVELAEQPQVFCALWPRLIVVGRARHPQQFALLLDPESPVRGIDPLPFVVSR